MSNNSQNKNTISVNAGLPTGNLTISVANLSQAVTATNNRAQYYADQAKKFLSETRELFESTKYYAEQNTDVTYGYIDGVKSELMLDYNSKLASKQNINECLLIDDLPENVSAFNNDSGYLVDSDLDEVRFPIQTNNQGKYLTTNGTSVSWENMPVRNVGETVFSLLPLTDSGLHLLDGSLIDGSGIYSNFVNYIADLYENNPSANYFTTEVLWQQSVTTYGVCGKFVYDSVDNTVRLPKVTGFVEGTIDLTALGELTGAGLPNITGGMGQGNALNTSGAFYIAGGTGFGFNANYGSATFFDASRSSSIYKNNFNKVQPQSIKGFYYIVVTTSQKTDIQVDIDEIVTDLNGKINTDLTNFPKPYLKTTYENGTSGYRIWSDGYCEQWGMIDKGDTGTAGWVITFLKTFSNTDYQAIATNGGNTSQGGYGAYVGISSPSKTVSGMSGYCWVTETSCRWVYWKVSGYLAQGEY